ncbi:MAG: ABC transporter ATP-binding protein [Chloroflexi bacterium]|nr:ABC transporter ATP-binding protein [Chloroflexota bacterium]
MEEQTLTTTPTQEQSGGPKLLVEIENLKTYFKLDEGLVKAVDGVTFDIYRGETLGIVGESGCGKSITARSILQIIDPPGKIVEGSIRYHRAKGTQEQVIDIAQIKPNSPLMRSIRGEEMAMIFQEPMTSLSPVYTIGNQIIEAIQLHRKMTKQEARNEAIDLLRKVGIANPEQRVDEYPHQLSGGMRQRAMIAMALSCHPRLLLADEPTTALDVTTQSQILELMLELKREMGMAIVMITHDLGVVAEMAQRVVVMYLGRAVEVADVRSLFHDPKHPYTQGLMQSVPKIGRKTRERLQPIKGMVPNPYNRPKGCLFHPRCPQCIPGKCDLLEPPTVNLPGGRAVSCWLYEGSGQS